MKKHNINMIGLYFKIGRRNLIKNKVYSLINLSGLAVGLAACILITLFVRDELSFDKHFNDHQKIYRISGSYDSGGDVRTVSALTSYLLKPNIENQFNKISYITRVDFTADIVTIEEQHFLEERIAKVDSIFFDVFQFDFLRGDKNALINPSGVVITEGISEKYFNGDDPMGQFLEINDKQFSVSGVIATPPSNSHFQAEIFLPIHGVLEWYPDWVVSNFTGYGMYTYIKTSDEINETALASQMNKYIADSWDNLTYPEYFLQKLSSIHLHSAINNEVSSNGSILVVYVFSAIAIIILLLACINYINLSLAGSFQRSKEVGMKKVLGASKKSQVAQFQLESFLITFCGALLAILIVILAMPYFNILTEKSISFNFANDYLLILAFLGLVLFIGFVTGSFPAMFLLKIPALSGLRGNILNRGKQKFSVRNALVSLQFFVSVTLIVSTLAIINQIDFLRSKDLGIDPKQIIMVPLQTSEMSNKYTLFREELLRNPSIQKVSASNNKVTNRVGGWRGYSTPEKEEELNCATVVISHDFFNTMGAKIISGRDYSRDFPADATQAYIINESAAKFFGMDVDSAVGQSLTGAAFTGSSWATKEAKVIGVVKDFHFASLHNEVRPIVFSLHSAITAGLFWVEVKVDSENMRSTIDVIESAWKEFSPDRPFYFEFMEEEIQAHYQKESTFLRVFSTFSFLSIFIGCLGLFGITAFVMKWRTKEIGIRKVLGAKADSLIVLLSKDFLKLIVISNILGLPLAYFLIKEWTQNFAYQAPISFWIFILAGAGLLLIALLTVLYHTLKAVRSNPVNAIKYE